MQEAVEFIKEQALSITKLLTKTHHNVLSSFINLKNKSEKMIEERDELHQKWIYCERALALKTPVREAEFALDDQSALSLYDCLVPMLKRHRRFRIAENTKFSIPDYQTQKKVYQLKFDLN